MIRLGPPPSCRVITSKVHNNMCISINALPVFQYTLDCPNINMTKVEDNRAIQTDIINLENKIIWISP